MLDSYSALISIGINNWKRRKKNSAYFCLILVFVGGCETLKKHFPDHVIILLMFVKINSVPHLLNT